MTMNDAPQTIKHTLRLPLGVLVDDEWKEIGVVEVPVTLHVNTVHGRTLASMKPVAGNDVTRTPACETCHGKAGVHECGCWASEDRQPVCGHCKEGDKGISVAWPCPTLRILDGGVES